MRSGVRNSTAEVFESINANSRLRLSRKAGERVRISAEHKSFFSFLLSLRIRTKNMKILWWVSEQLRGTKFSEDSRVNRSRVSMERCDYSSRKKFVSIDCGVCYYFALEKNEWIEKFNNNVGFLMRMCVEIRCVARIFPNEKMIRQSLCFRRRLDFEHPWISCKQNDRMKILKVQKFNQFT